MRKTIKFTIKKGQHYSRPLHLGAHFGITKLKFRFMFTQECAYPIQPNDTDDFDINKLCGFSHGYHHHNSVRFGWLPSLKEPGKIELYRYVYNHGKRIPDYIPIATVNTKEWYDGELVASKLYKQALFVVKKDGLGITSASTAYETPAVTWGYALDPYFGGDYTAPHDMGIYLDFWDGYWTPESVSVGS
jgi:hypothetical protein